MLLITAHSILGSGWMVLRGETPTAPVQRSARPESHIHVCPGFNLQKVTWLKTTQKCQPHRRAWLGMAMQTQSASFNACGMKKAGRKQRQESQENDQYTNMLQKHLTEGLYCRFCKSMKLTQPGYPMALWFTADEVGEGLHLSSPRPVIKQGLCQQHD